MIYSKRTFMNKRIKKGIALTLVTALVLTLISWIDVISPIRAEESGTTPSVKVFATPVQLMDSGNFNLEGDSGKVGSIIFGRSNGQPMSWYIAGRDSGNGSNNIVLFAKKPLINNIWFANEISDTVSYDNSWDCNYPTTPASVYANHYGGSHLRAALKEAAQDTAYFSSSEQNLMLSTTVQTGDTCNNTEYTTTDKLYPAFCISGSDINNHNEIYVGSNNGLKINISNLPNDSIWLRTPQPTNYICFLVGNNLINYTQHYNTAKSGLTDSPTSAYPAFDLDLSSVLFASAVPSAYTTSGTITSGSEMTLRLDGTSKLSDSYVKCTSDGIEYQISSGQQIVIQGNDGTRDWYFKSDTYVSRRYPLSEIKRIANLTDNPDLTKCKIWIEKTENNLTYAKMADSDTPSMEKVKTPTADIASGNYTSNQRITLDCTTEGADIYYTTDGSTPTSSGTKYTDSIPVNGTSGSSVTTTIKAIDVKSGMSDSEMAEFSYTINLPETHGHIWNDAWNYNKDAHWHECTSEGCPITEDSEKDGYYQHTEDDGTITVEPTENSAGSKVYKCKICGYEMRIEMIPATGNKSEENTNTENTTNNQPVTENNPVNTNENEDSDNNETSDQKESDEEQEESDENNEKQKDDQKEDEEPSVIADKNNNGSDHHNTKEPKTGDFSSIKLYHIVFVIAFLCYVVLCFEKRVSEDQKKEILEKWILWGKKGSFLRRYLAMILIFAFLAYYHSIGKKT